MSLNCRLNWKLLLTRSYLILIHRIFLAENFLQECASDFEMYQSSSFLNENEYLVSPAEGNWFEHEVNLVSYSLCKECMTPYARSKAAVAPKVLEVTSTDCGMCLSSSNSSRKRRVPKVATVFENAGRGRFRSDKGFEPVFVPGFKQTGCETIS